MRVATGFRPNAGPWVQGLSLTGLLWTLGWISCAATPPSDLQISGIPDLLPDLEQTIDAYDAPQANYFEDWDPTARRMLVAYSDDTMQQLHVLLAPNGETRLPTLFPGVVNSGSFMPKKGDLVIFAADHLGDEFYQLYSLATATGQTKMLTDGESQNNQTIYGHGGLEIAFRSNMLDRKNADIYVTDPRDPHSTRMLMKIDSPGWELQDWAHDDAHILASHIVARDMGYLWLINASSGETRLLTQQRENQRRYVAARFTPKDDALWLIEAGEDGRQFISWLPLAPTAVPPKVPTTDGDVQEIALSPDGAFLAYVEKKDDIDELHLFDTRSGTEEPEGMLARGYIGRVRWNGDGTEIGFRLGSLDSPPQAYAYSLATHRVEQWTSAGTAAPKTGVARPERISISSFDNLPISGYLYRPDPARFPGRRPVLIRIHGGPEAEYLPDYSPEVNYYLTELGVAVLFPNVRGSSGFGERFASLDDGFRREDAVKDIGAFLDWIPTNPSLDPNRVGVQGTSYGGYMTLAALYHYSNRLRCGSDLMGITDFVTFLRNTEIYRQANRRHEYGDERYPDMNTFLQSISPLNHVAEMGDPVMITAGKNDPRVPVSESDQMVTALRSRKDTVWYIVGENEGHGFRRSSDSRYQFAAEALFFQTYLLPEKRVTPLLPEAPPAPAAAGQAGID